MTTPMIPEDRDFTKLDTKDIWLLWQLVANLVTVLLITGPWLAVAIIVEYAIFATAWRLAHPS